jgi:hypothetical protein
MNDTHNSLNWMQVEDRETLDHELEQFFKDFETNENPLLKG